MLRSRHKSLTSCSGGVVSQHPAASRREAVFKGSSHAGVVYSTTPLPPPPLLPPLHPILLRARIGAGQRSAATGMPLWRRPCLYLSIKFAAGGELRAVETLELHPLSPPDSTPTTPLPLCVVQGFFFLLLRPRLPPCCLCKHFPGAKVSGCVRV